MSLFDLYYIILENFRSYKGQHRFDFPSESGLYNLTGRNEENPRLGPNGCGKSTLLDAIFWVLYGKTTRGLRAGDILSWHTENAPAVTLGLTIGTWRGTLRRTQSPNSLTIDGRAVDQAEVDKLLRLSPEAFSYGVMLPQFGRSFFDLTPAEKLSLFSQIMELEFWLEKSQEAARLAGELESERAKLERVAAKLGGEVNAAKADLVALEEHRVTFAEHQAATIKAMEAEGKLLATSRKQLEARLADTRKVLWKAQKRLENLQKPDNKCPTCGQPIPTPEYTQTLKTLSQNHTDFEHECWTLERQISTEDAKVTSLLSSIETETKRVNPYAELIQAKEKLLLTVEQQLVGNHHDIQNVGAEHAAVNYWVAGFKRVRLFIVEAALAQLELEVNNNLTGLGLSAWRVSFDVERENKSGGLTKGFTTFVHPPGAEEAVRFESYSGGEIQRLRLAGDLGLANLIMEQAGLTNMVEFYDEFSSHLSAEGITDVLDVLKERAISLERKIWVVDHHVLNYGDFADVLCVIKMADGSHLVWQ